MSEETKVELPAVVTFADLVDAQHAYERTIVDADPTIHCVIQTTEQIDRQKRARLRLNAIAERLGLVDRVGVLGDVIGNKAYWEAQATLQTDK